MSYKLLTVRLALEDHEALRLHASDLDLTMAQYVRKLLREAAEHTPQGRATREGAEMERKLEAMA